MGVFDPEFFPTPRALAQKMLDPYRAAITAGEIGSVLDPEAGKGDLLKPLIAMRERPRLYAIEKDPDLRGALAALEVDREYHRNAEKAIHVLGDDVFAYEGRHVFDLILANPPFSDGATHALRHVKLLADGGRMAVLLNAETIRNPCNATRREFADVIALYGGTVEEIGAAFALAERPTDVAVVLVRLQKPAAAGAFQFGRAERERSAPRLVPPEIVEDAIARRDFVGNAAIAFDLAARALTELSTAWRRADHYLELAGVPLESLLPLDHRADASPNNVNALLDAAQAKAWQSIIERSDVERYFTAKMRKDFDVFMAGQGRLDFNRANVLALFEMIFLSRHSIADAAVQDVFDRMCAFDPANKAAGWKTNSGHKVNMKVIVPHYITHEFGSFHVSHYREYSDLDDIDKALCHVTGRAYSGIDGIQATLGRAFAARNAGATTANLATSTFFDMRFFKKGTLHLHFREQAVWEAFNIAAARGKGWLGAERSEGSTP